MGMTRVLVGTTLMAVLLGVGGAGQGCRMIERDVGSNLRQRPRRCDSRSL